jgi:hypothetical protein
MTTTNPGRLHSMLLAISPHWALARHNWRERRRRDRQKLERQLEQLRGDAIWEPPSQPPEARERIRIGPPREGWRWYADQLSAERRRMTITNARANLTRTGMYDRQL